MPKPIKAMSKVKVNTSKKVAPIHEKIAIRAKLLKEGFELHNYQCDREYYEKLVLLQLNFPRYAEAKVQESFTVTANKQDKKNFGVFHKLNINN